MVQSKLLLEFPTLLHFFFDRKNFFALNNSFLTLEQCIRVEQVHGDQLITVSDNKQKYFLGADGLVTTQTLFLAIKTADCLPLFFFEPKRKILAAVHAGWKGLFSGIVKNAINTLENLGAKRSEIVCAVGPHIGACCYNVSFSRISGFKKLGYNVKKIAKQENSNWYLDLAQIAKIDMLNLRLQEKNIDISNICTSCNKRFYSYRRDKNSCGRMWNVLGRIESA